MLQGLGGRVGIIASAHKHRNSVWSLEFPAVIESQSL